MRNKKPKGWLYHPRQDPVCIDLHSDEYKSKLDSKEWFTSRAEANESPDTQTDYDELGIADLKRIATDRGLEFQKNAKRPTMIKLLKG